MSVPLSNLKRIRARLGDGVVLLSVAKGRKNPTLHGWEKVGLTAMQDPRYLATLETGNVGVLLGQVSGGLCALDFDRQEDADTFFALNPKLVSSFRSCGARGCQVWIVAQGVYPDSGNAKAPDGQTACEWRAAGRQSIVWGTHPDGMNYRWLVDAPPLEITFADIIWPEAWRCPWMPVPEDPGTMADQRLTKEHGAPFTTSAKGKVTLNSMYFVARFAQPGDVLYEPNEGEFYAYQVDQGLWRRHTSAALKIEFAATLKEYADAQHPDDAEQIVNARNGRFLDDLVGLLQGHVEERDAFERKQGIIHVANGMLHLGFNSIELRKFNASYRSRNVSPVAFNPAAECPRFRRELLESALPPEDVSLVQRYAGACLLGRNLAQKILVLTGTAGGGKSTFLEILERILGLANVCEIRTEHLQKQFEIFGFVGKQLLTGKDVPGQFLEEEGAHKLKSLVGHDLLTAEPKNSNTRFPVRGDFAVIITCNSRLKVRLDGDTDAWRRRLLIVKYERPKPKRPELDFAGRLLEEEGPGILRWMVDGARSHLQELQDVGGYRLTIAQKWRTDALLAESDSVREFIRKRVDISPGSDVTVFELTEAYSGFCDDMGWEPLPVRRVENALADAMQELRRSARRNDIVRDCKPKKGFGGVKLVEISQEEAVDHDA